MTAAEALAGLAPIIGGGGVAGIIIAYLGFRAEALKGRKVDSASVAVGVGQGFLPAKDREILITIATDVNASFDRAVAIAELFLELSFPNDRDVHQKIEERLLKRKFDDYRKRAAKTE